MAVADRAWCLVVPHHARGARVARHRLAAELADTVAPPLLADVITIVAELVGNAVRHADPLPGGVVRVAWRLRPVDGGQVIEVRVTDGGAAGRPQVQPLDIEASDGRGLTIVSALADRWGVDRDGLGQSVWAELSGSSATADHQAVLRADHAPPGPSVMGMSA
jgi:anti-sigma regulatory factor (Ser/Thr protein kinase)